MRAARWKKSAVLEDTNLAAHLQDRAGGAFGKEAGADVLAKRDEEAVDLDPVFTGEFLLELCHGFLRRRSGDVAPAVGDAVDVDVNADVWLAAGDADGEVGAFGADAGEGH